MKESDYKTYLLKSGLFVLTIITTTLSGAELMFGRSFVYGDTTLGWVEFVQGLSYTFPFLLFLTVHELGHYITAKYYKVKVSLPSYIPMWLGFVTSLSFGTMGAFIKIQSMIKSNKEHFDIGIAGPLAGFVIAVFVLLYGFTHLPAPEYVFEIHPEFESFGEDYADKVYHMDTVLFKKEFTSTERYNYEYTSDSVIHSTAYPSIKIGKNLLFLFFENYIVQDKDKSKIPNAYELMHYPWLFAGFLALLFTALNLLPIGQLDGGHVLYGLCGAKWHKQISEVTFVGFVIYASLGAVSPYQEVSDLMMWGTFYVGFLCLVFQGLKRSKMQTVILALSVFVFQLVVGVVFPEVQGYQGWLLFAFLIGRFLGVYHPRAIDESPLDFNRQLLGWIALFIFIICFSPQPLMVG